jgi:hypothetical protein
MKYPQGKIECRRVREGVSLDLFLPEAFYQIFVTEENPARKAQLLNTIGSDVGRVLTTLYEIEVETIHGKAPKVTGGVYGPEESKS